MSKNTQLVSVRTRISVQPSFCAASEVGQRPVRPVLGFRTRSVGFCASLLRQVPHPFWASVSLPGGLDSIPGPFSAKGLGPMTGKQQAEAQLTPVRNQSAGAGQGLGWTLGLFWTRAGPWPPSASGCHLPLLLRQAQVASRCAGQPWGRRPGARCVGPGAHRAARDRAPATQP